MSAIQSSVGLITGIPIQETVDRLVAISAIPRNSLANRTAAADAERLAVQKLSSLLLAFQFEINKLSTPDVFDERKVTSSNSDFLSASVSPDGRPTPRSILFTPIQKASNQQLLSQSFDPAAAVGAGSFTFRVGGFVDKGVSLDTLNSGVGIQRGEIHITDRSGSSSAIDLRFASTVDDVLNAINDNTEVSVTATAAGNAFRLTDNSGGSGNLVVQEVGSSTTAASLGLDGTNTSSAEATGADVFSLHAGTKLAALNDGNGVQIRAEGISDLRITFGDQSEALQIDLSGSVTLGDVLEELNSADPARLAAAVSSDGNRIQLTDLTSGAGTFSVSNVGGGTTAEDLGIATSTTSATITGNRIVAGLRDVLVRTLKGGQGLGSLGSIDITNRDGLTSNVDLSSAETLGEIVEAINSQATGVVAAVNPQRHGILLNDVTGGSASDFIVADGDASNSATALNIAVADAVTTVNSGSLSRQTLSEATLLSSLKIGQDFKVSDITITDSSGQIGSIDLNSPGSEAKTIGDVIEKINNSAANVLARINDGGDGIVIIDQADGNGVLSVADVGSGTTAANLGLRKEAENGQIDGTTTYTVTIDDDDTIDDVVETVNGLNVDVTASTVNDGIGRRLSLSVSDTGAANELILDTSNTAITFQEISAARDGLLLYGSTNNAAAGVILRSSTNEFQDVVDGLNLTVQNADSETVAIDVATSNASLKETLVDLVDAYNSIRSNLDEVTDFNEEDLTTGILFGSGAALRVDVDLANILGSRISGIGQFTTLEALGISFNPNGKLEFDSDKFDDAYASDPAAVTDFFTDEESGFVAKVGAVLEQLVGEDSSILTTRSKALIATVEANSDRIESMDARLERERNRLLLEFARLEETIASLQQNLTALSTLQVLPAQSVSGNGATSLFNR